MQSQEHNIKPKSRKPSDTALATFWFSSELSEVVSERRLTFSLGNLLDTRAAGPEYYVVSPGRFLDSHVMKLLLTQNRADRDRIAVLEGEVAKLRTAVGLEEPEIRSLSRVQAKKEIKAYFEKHDGETVFPSDVAEALALDYDVVVDLVDELETKGQIAKA